MNKDDKEISDGILNLIKTNCKCFLLHNSKNTDYKELKSTIEGFLKEISKEREM